MPRRPRSENGPISDPEKGPILGQDQPGPESAKPISGQSNRPDPDGSEKGDRRIRIYVDDGLTEIKWNRLKSTDQTKALQGMIRREATKLGMVDSAAPAGGPAPGPAITAKDVLGIYNAMVVATIVGSSGGRVGPVVASTLAFSDADIAALNEDGRADRLAQKYLGNLAWQYKDEVLVGFALVNMVWAKTQAFKAALRAPATLHAMPGGRKDTEEGAGHTES